MVFDTSLPEVDKAKANRLFVFLTTPPAATTGIPTLTEVNAGLNAGCYLYGGINVTPTQNSGEGPAKWCVQSTPTVLTDYTYPPISLQYSYKQQLLATPGDPANALYEALPMGAEVTVVILDGVESKTTAISAPNNIADIFKTKAGVQAKGQTSDDNLGEISVTQQLEIVGGEPVALDHALAA